MRRWIAALLAALLLCTGVAWAEPDGTDAAYEAAQVHEIVESLFAACAGTTLTAEQEARAELSEEALLERNAENAAYRAQTLPWLLAALEPEIAADAWTEGADEAATEKTEAALPGDVPSTEDELAPEWTAEDSYAAFLTRDAGREYLALLAPLGGTDFSSCLEVTRELCSQWLAEIDHVQLTEINGDYAFWLYAPDSQIDYPVVHGTDNQFYLKRMFNGDWNSSGTLFVDYRNLPDFQDPNTLVYGHHMRNDSMFGSLTDYGTQEYYEAHPYMLVIGEREIDILELFAGYTTGSDDHCYDIAISDEADMLAFIEAAVQKSDFVTDVQVQTSDRLVTLSTCAYVFENARYIAIGRLIPVWQAVPPDAVDVETGE